MGPGMHWPRAIEIDPAAQPRKWIGKDRCKKRSFRLWRSKSPRLRQIRVQIPFPGPAMAMPIPNIWDRTVSKSLYVGVTRPESWSGGRDAILNCRSEGSGGVLDLLKVTESSLSAQRIT